MFVGGTGQGFIHRKQGPAGRRYGGVPQGARGVHADNDAWGLPLREDLAGLAPWLFHPPNPWSPLGVYNLWVPLRQAVRPLALMDIAPGAGMNRSRDQLRHRLAYYDRFNDIWLFHHHQDQQWHWHSGIGTHNDGLLHRRPSPLTNASAPAGGAGVSAGGAGVAAGAGLQAWLFSTKSWRLSSREG